MKKYKDRTVISLRNDTKGEMDDLKSVGDSHSKFIEVLLLYWKTGDESIKENYKAKSNIDEKIAKNKSNNISKNYADADG
ncbi:MAG: hypothetical protein LBM26_02970 [Methanobrevibacter sp.]|jgi:hypothetical protein|nr:hypothetical protein [Methanobrevibacter sp.]